MTDIKDIPVKEHLELLRDYHMESMASVNAMIALSERGDNSALFAGLVIMNMTMTTYLETFRALSEKLLPTDEKPDTGKGADVLNFPGIL